MCNVCCAGKAIEETATKGFATFTRDEGVMLVQMEANGPEFEPGRARFRSARDPEWSAWVEFEDGASFTSRLGLDVAWKYVARPVRRYIVGRGARSTVVAHMAGSSVRTGAKLLSKPRKPGGGARLPVMPVNLYRALYPRPRALPRRIAANMRDMDDWMWRDIGGEGPAPSRRVLKQEDWRSGERARRRAERAAINARLAP